MKKVLFILAAVALLASCNKKGEGTTPTEDSLSTAYGTMAGYGIKMQVSGTPDSVNYDEFEGFGKGSCNRSRYFCQRTQLPDG